MGGRLFGLDMMEKFFMGRGATMWRRVQSRGLLSVRGRGLEVEHDGALRVWGDKERGLEVVSTVNTRRVLGTYLFAGDLQKGIKHSSDQYDRNYGKSFAVLPIALELNMHPACSHSD